MPSGGPGVPAPARAAADLRHELKHIDDVDAVGVDDDAEDHERAQDPVRSVSIGETQQQQQERHRIQDAAIAELGESPRPPHEVGEHDQRDAEP